MKPTIYDISRKGVSGHTFFDKDVDLSTSINRFDRKVLRDGNLGLPELTEVELVRHYTNLTRDNYGVDNGTYPLGSCTMKYNPKRNDKFSALAGFENAHPLQPEETLAGLWKFMFELQSHFSEITGMDSFTLQPAAGANGELAGLYIIRKYFDVERKEKRNVILIADSAHGTNPATATMAEFECRIIRTNKNGTMDLVELKKAIAPDVAALMLTNPSTLGLFESNIVEIANMLHDNGSLLYYDGANLNALMGIVRPGDMGFDVIHINTHKTFSTPHSGGGPGAGPVGVKQYLSSYLPIPVAEKSGCEYFPNYELKNSIGKMKCNYGHIDILIKAFCYILTNGPDGLLEVSENAVLNANYMQAKLKDIIPPVFDRYCMHECLLNGDVLEVSAYYFAKRLIDYDVHPPTLVGAGCVYFSNDLGSAILLEPTETETKQSLDKLVGIMIKVWNEVKEDENFVKNAPYSKFISQIPRNSKEVE